MTDQSDSPGSPEKMLVGQRLQSAREAMQMSASDVANALHITITYVNFIEKNQFNKLPGAIFARGYIKLYARLVNLPVDEVMTSYFEQSGDSPRECQVRPAVNEYGASMRRHAIKWAIAVVLMVLLIPTLGWWYTHHDDLEVVTTISTDTTASSPIVTENTTAEVVTTTTETDSADTPTPTLLPTTSDVKIDSVMMTQQPTIDAAVKSSIDTKTSTEALDITFTEKCWIQVKNIDGVILHDAEHQAGEHITIGGKSPFYVWVKNGKAVSISFNGQAVKIDNIDNKGAARLVVGK